MPIRFRLLLFALLLPLLPALAQTSPLPAIDRQSPRATVATFLAAMNDYVAGVEADDAALRARIDDATLCLDLGAFPAERRQAEGRQATMLLKEVLDRLPELDATRLPATADATRHQLGGTELTLVRQQGGATDGDYLFAAETVRRARSLYERVRSTPYRAGTRGALYEQQQARTESSTKRLAPIKTETPRETMRTYLRAMNDYADGFEQNDPELLARLDDAVECLQLDQPNALLRQEQGREAAKLLKEVIDRVIYIDYEKIPDTASQPSWRLKDTRIVLVRVNEGPRQGEYLFSAATVASAKDFYDLVKDLDYIPGGRGAYYSEPWADLNVPDWARARHFGVANWQWIGLFAAILLGLTVRVITRFLLAIVKRLARRSKTDWDDRIVDAIEGPAALLLASLFWFVSVYALRFSGKALDVLVILVQLVVSVAVIWLLYRLVEVVTEYLQTLTSKTESTLDDHLVPLLRRALRIFVVIFGFLVAIQTLGFNIWSLLAGLGLGGLAFALAAKDTCANLFGSLMIFIDSPFQIGDWVIVGSTEGTVEEIGFRSTRIRTFYNSLVSVPNSVIANADIDNMGRRQYRRIKAYFGIAYDTPARKVEAFTEGIKNIVKANPYTRKDYYHVVFNSFGDAYLEIMLYCFLKVPDWATELVERQNIYLEILRLAEELHVEFAFPTQTLHVDSFPGQEPRRLPHDESADALAARARSFGPDGELAHPGGQGLFTPPYKE